MRFLFIIFLFYFIIHNYAQSIGIGEHVFVPHPSAGLEINFSDKGILIPRVTLTSSSDNSTIPSPAYSLLVYHTGSPGLPIPGFYYNQGSPSTPNWIKIGSETGWLLEGNGGTNPSTQFLGTTDAQPLIIRTHNQERMRITQQGLVGIGTLTPSAKLHISSRHNTSPFLVQLTDIPSPSCWLTGWNYRIPIYIQNSSPNVLNDYQVLIKFASNSLISSGKMQANCADIRITDADGCTLLNFWIEGGLNSSSTFVWTKVPSIPANGVKIIYLYYGNPSASSASIGQSTFLFFDDFLGTTLDPSRWITTGHSGYLPMFYTVSGGILTEWSDNQWRILAANYTSATNELIAVEAKISKSNSSRWHVHYLVQGSDANNARFGIVDDGYPGLNIGIQVKCPSGSYELPYDLGPILNDVWYTMRILRKSSIHFYADVLSSTTREIVNSTAFFEHQRTCWSTIPNWRWVNWQSSNVQVKYDWIFIRKYQDPEPNLIVGSEEVYNPSPSLRNSIFVHPQTGNVGINTTTPGFYTLFVEGLAFARGGWFSSDARLKHFIQPIQESYTQRLLKLTPVQFKWNQNAYPSKRFPSGQHFGLLAQEVEKIFPDLVMQDPINEKSVAYIEFIPLLIAAYQNMHKTLESYKQDIQNLQRENQMLKGEINNLKTKLSKP